MAHSLTQSVLEIDVEDDFMGEFYTLRKPCIIRNLDIGPAPKLWTAEYLSDKCGTREVKVHVCPHQAMDFINKNFAYK